LDEWGKEWLFEAERLGKPVYVLGGEPDGSLRVRLSDGTERLTTTGELIM